MSKRSTGAPYTTAFAKTLLDDADVQAAKATLGLGSIYGTFGGLVGLGDSYSQLGGNSITVATTADIWTNFLHSVGAALSIPADEVRILGRSGGAISSPTCGDTTDAQGIGVIMKHIYPNSYYTGAVRPTGKAYPALFILKYNYNEVLRNAAYSSTGMATIYKHHIRTACNRIRAAAVYDSRSAQVVFTTGFATTTASPYPVSTSGVVSTGAAPDNLACTGSSWRISKAASDDKFTCTIPPDWSGGTAAVTLIASPGTKCYLNTALTDTTGTTVVLKGSILGDLGYKVLAAGDRIVMDEGNASEEYITLGSTADGGITWTGCTRNANGAGAHTHSVSAVVTLPTTTGKIIWTDSTATGASGHADTYISGLGGSSDGVYQDIGTSHRCGGFVTVRFTIPASDAGLTIVGKTSGLVGKEYVGFDSFTLEDSNPPPILLVNQPNMGGTMIGGGSFFTTTNAGIYNQALTDVAAEFDQAVKVVDVATDGGTGTMTSLFKGTVQTAISSGATTTLHVTPIDATQCVLSAGSLIRVLGSSGVETMRINADITKTSNTDWSCPVTRNYDSAGAQTTIAIGQTVMDSRWLAKDWIHPSDLGHKLYAAKCLDTLATITQTTQQITTASGYALRRKPRLADGAVIPNSAQSGGTKAAATIGTLYAYPIELPEDAELIQLSCNITAAANASGLLRFGVWTDGASMPGALILDSRVYTGVDLTQGSTGERTAAVFQPLKAGWYWIGVAVQGTGTMATMRTYSSVNSTYPLQSVTAGVISTNTAVDTVSGYTFSGITGALSGFSTMPSGMASVTGTIATWAKFSVPIRD